MKINTQNLTVVFMGATTFLLTTASIIAASKELTKESLIIGGFALGSAQMTYTDYKKTVAPS